MPNTSAIRWTYDDKDAQRLLSRIRDRGSDWRPAARLFHREMILRTDSMFERLRRGGTYRGEYWRYFAIQYIRKTDGMVVPAWGGVPKIRGKGLVKGRKRHSGARIQEGDAVGQDTGHLRRSALQAVRLWLRQMTMGQNVNYDSAFSRIREFAFFHLPDDLTLGRRILLAHLEGRESF